MNIYLDLNIFDRLEKIDKLEFPEREIYQKLYDTIIQGKLNVPFSNAHLNDLFRGYQKNPSYIEKHLDNIEKLTKNFCICQYWGDANVRWHYRNIKEFFEEKKSDWKFETDSFSELFEDDPVKKNLLDFFKTLPLPDNFRQGYKEPIFGIMYPLSKVYNNYYSLMEDLYNFQTRIKSDYSLYKSFKIYLLQSVQKLNDNREVLKTINSNFQKLPKHLQVIDLANEYSPKNKTSENNQYSKIINLFFKYDLNGYKTDGNFNNMFDDALHSFYGSQCDFFITNDERCRFKAEKTYIKLGIKTKVIKSEQIPEILNGL